MTQQLATVNSHVLGEATPRAGATTPAERLRLQFAEAWGEMSASWGVAPAIGRVHAYLMVRNVPLTEREIREALGLSHRAASLALTDAEAGGSSNVSRSPGGSGVADPRAPRTWRLATTGSGSPGSSP